MEGNDEISIRDGDGGRVYVNAERQGRDRERSEGGFSPMTRSAYRAS